MSVFAMTFDMSLILEVSVIEFGEVEFLGY